MPRRMITSEICRNEKIANLPDAGRFLFIGIFSNADDDGRLKASPKFLKATIFPYDEGKTTDQVKQLRDQCATLGLIRLYSKNGAEYLDLPGWQEHQLIRKDRYRPSKLPSYDDADEAWQPSGNQVATTGRRSIVKSSIVKSSKPPYIPPFEGETKELFDLWNSLGLIKHIKLTGDMTRAIKAASRDFSVAEISQAMRNYAHIVNDEQCYFKYRWTLKDFLKRGLEKFLDLEVALNNYRKVDTGKSRESRRHPAEDRPAPESLKRGLE